LASGYKFECDRCGYIVETMGPSEFYRDGQRNRKPYGHPLPFPGEALDYGVKGLSADLYCPFCKKIFDMVMVEFDIPYHCDKGEIFWDDVEDPDRHRNEGSVICPGCKHVGMILGPLHKDECKPGAEGEMLAGDCPKCGEGILVSRLSWMS